MTDLSDDEALAAEYVLGTLDGPERADAEARRRQDPNFAALTAAWAARFAPLDDAVPDVLPSRDLLDDILSRLPRAEERSSPADNILILRHRVRVWRGVAAAATAVAAMLALWVVGREVLAPGPDQQTYVAVLQHGADTPSFLVSLDLADRRMTVTPLAVNVPPGKSYQLWMIGSEQGTPRSMGVFDGQSTMRPRLPDMDGGAMSNATYAVTLEPSGGSPTGQPTSAPVFVGKLIHASL